MRVRRGPHGGVKIDLVEVEAGILAQCVRELLELLSLPAPDQPPDPLAMMVGRTYSEVPTVFGTQSRSIPTKVTSERSASSGSRGGMHICAAESFMRCTCFCGLKSRTLPSAPRKAWR